MERVIANFKKGFHNKTLEGKAKQAALLQAWIWYLEDPTFRKGYIKLHCLEQGAKEAILEAKKGTTARARRQVCKPQKKTPPGLLGDEPADEDDEGPPTSPPGRFKGCALM